MLCRLAAPVEAERTRGLVITKEARKSVTGAAVQQQVISGSKPGRKVKTAAASYAALQPADSYAHEQRDAARESESIISNDVRPGLRKQASAIDPEQAKQLEKGWGLSYKDPSAPAPVRKEVGMSILLVATRSKST